MLLANTYHLHLRPGERSMRELGGLHALHELAPSDPDDSAATRCSASADYNAIDERWSHVPIG
jgi:tRNA-guanine family transglycosylase